MSGPENPRLLALDAVTAVLDRQRNLEEAKALAPGTLDPRDISFARHLAYGVLRWLAALEWIAAQLLERPLKSRDRDIHRLILLGLFELWKESSAQHAAVNETAECARRLCKPWAVGLINAVLRRFQREQSKLTEQLSNQIEQYAHPGWLVQRLQADWPDHWQVILDEGNRPGELWLRVNVAKSSVEAVMTEIRKSGFEADAHPFANAAVKVTPAAPVNQLPGFTEGMWSVQDPAAQLAVDWLSLQPGHHVLDACAAPGGKACHILESTSGVRLMALDRSEGRLNLLRGNMERLQLGTEEKPEIVCADASDVGSWWNGVPFDRILLDAPCTATGVIRRHPEIKWLRSEEQLAQVTQQQAKLLRRLWPLLKAGSILVYTTCSILRDENDRQIRLFLDDHADAVSSGPDLPYGHALAEGRQVLPGEFSMDGFYYARLRKSH